MIYLGYLLATIISFLLLGVIGYGIFALAPIKRITPLQEFFAPLLGLAALTLLSVIYYRLPFSRSIHPLFFTAILVCGALFLNRDKLLSLFKGRAIIFCIIASLPIFFQFIRYGFFVPLGGDAIFYINIAQYATQFNFLTPPPYPFNADPMYFDHMRMSVEWVNGVRLGSILFVSWLEQCLFLKWSYEAYPIAVALGLVSAAYSIIGVIKLVIPTKKVLLPYLVGLVVACTSNGFSWGAIFDFFPHTFGMPFCLLFIVFFVCVILDVQSESRTVRRTSMEWLRVCVIPGLLAATLMYTYSEILLPLMTVALIGTIYLCVFYYYKLGRHAVIVAAQPILAICLATGAMVVLLANVEIYRVFKNLISVVHLGKAAIPVGWPFPWELWEFWGFSFGIRPAWDNILLRMYNAHFAGSTASLPGLRAWVLGILIAFLLFIFYTIWKHRHKINLPLFFAVIALPSIMLLIGLPYFRYISINPWDIGIGQSFFQLRTATWSTLFCLVVMGVAFVAYAQKGRLQYFVSCFILSLWIVFGLAFYFDHASIGAHLLMKTTQGKGFNKLLEVREVLEKRVPRNEPVALDLPSHSPVEVWLTYVLWDREVIKNQHYKDYKQASPYFCKAKFALRLSDDKRGRNRLVAQIGGIDLLHNSSGFCRQ